MEGKADRRRELRCIALKRLGVDPGADADDVERINVLDFELETFGEEAVKLRKKRGAARDVELHGDAPALLRAVEVDGTRHFGVKARHHRAAGLGHAVARRVLVLDNAAEGDVRGGALVFLRLLRRAPERGAYLLRDRVARDGDRAVVELVAVDDHERRRLGADIEDDAAPAVCGARVAKHVREGDRRDVHELRRESRATHGGHDVLDLVDLRGDDHHVLLAVFVVAENLPVADHLVDRERNVLLDLETDHLVEPVRPSGGRDGREAREHHLPGNRDRDWTRLDALLADDLEERRREERARVAGVERSGEGGDAVVD